MLCQTLHSGRKHSFSSRGRTLINLTINNAHHVFCFSLGVISTSHLTHLTVLPDPAYQPHHL